MTLEMLKNGAKTVVGVKQTLRVITNGKAKTVFIAADADHHVTDALKKACSEKQVECLEVPSLMELGKACGIQVGAAAAALLKD